MTLENGLKELEAENARLKRIVADQALDVLALKDLFPSGIAQAEAVAFVPGDAFSPSATFPGTAKLAFLAGDPRPAQRHSGHAPAQARSSAY